MTFNRLLATIAVIALPLAALPAHATGWWNPPADQSAEASAGAGSGASNSASATGKHRRASASDSKYSETDAQVNIPKRGWAYGSANAESGVVGDSSASYHDPKKGSAENTLDMGTGGDAEVTVNGRTDKRGYEASVFGGASSEGHATGRHSSTDGGSGSWGAASGSAHVAKPGDDSAGAHAGMGSYAFNNTSASDKDYAAVNNIVGSGASAEAKTND